MDRQLAADLRAAGDELKAEHDDEVIADVINRVEDLDSGSSDQTAAVLRAMVGQSE